LSPESLITPALIQAYLAAHYRVDAQPPFTLQVGVFSEPLARHFQRHSCDCAAFLTACNPLSEDVGEAGNAARQAALARDLENLGLRLIDGMGLDGQDEGPQKWPGEASFLVFGLSLEASQALGRKYAQNALIWCGQDAVPQLILLQ